MRGGEYRLATSRKSSISSIAREKGDHVRAGTGLGLAIARGFVEAMNGTIRAAQSHRPGRRRFLHYTADSRHPTTS